MKLTFVEVAGPSVAVDYSDICRPIHTSSQSQSEIKDKLYQSSTIISRFLQNICQPENTSL